MSCSIEKNQMPFFKQIFPEIATKGARYNKIEDRIEIRGSINDVKIYAIYDGHGGSQVSEELSKGFARWLQRMLAAVDPNNTGLIRKIIRAAFIIKDKQIHDARKRRPEYDPGSTAVMAIYFAKTNRLFFAHSGDSRAVLFKVNRKKMPDGSTQVTLSEMFSTKDHKPSDPIEEARIKKAGGYVTKASRASVERVDGNLAVSRSFGDFHLKQNKDIDYDPIRGKVSVKPDIHFVTLVPGVEYRLFLASDGLWDEMTNRQLASMANSAMILNPELGKDLIRYARKKGGDDDISIIGVAIKLPATQKKRAASKPKAKTNRRSNSKAK